MRTTPNLGTQELNNFKFSQYIFKKKIWVKYDIFRCCIAFSGAYLKIYRKLSANEYLWIGSSDCWISIIHLIHYSEYDSCIYIQSFSLTECIVIVGVGRYRVVCVCVCVCVCLSVCLSVCLCRAVSRNYWADFNETFQKCSPIGLVVGVCVLAH